MYCKPRDPVGSNNRRTLYDTIFYKPEDDRKGLKHVALLIIVELKFTPQCCVRRTVNNKFKNNIQIYIKKAPTCFGVTVTPSSGSALISAY